MKTFRFLLFACCVSVCASCIEKVNTDINNGVDIAALEPMAEYEVPVKAGFTTVVRYADEVLAVTRTPIKISVPASAVTRANGLEVIFSDEDIFGEYGYISYWHYLSFEDTRSGDYDYNDVVLHGRVVSNFQWSTSTYTHTVSVQPVALGSAVKLGLGILYRDAAGSVREEILTDDIRRDLFNGDPTFPINTSLSKPKKKVSNELKPMFECTTGDSDFRIVWFLLNGEDRLYVATTNLGADKNYNMISHDGAPYGIALTKKWCYPLEKCNIRTAYPNFDQWLRTGDETVLLENPVRANVYVPATVKDGEDGDLWDYKK